MNTIKGFTPDEMAEAQRDAQEALAKPDYDEALWSVYIFNEPVYQRLVAIAYPGLASGDETGVWTPELIAELSAVVTS